MVHPSNIGRVVGSLIEAEKSDLYLLHFRNFYILTSISDFKKLQGSTSEILVIGDCMLLYNVVVGLDQQKQFESLAGSSFFIYSSLKIQPIYENSGTAPAV